MTLQSIIDDAWEKRDNLSPSTQGDIRKAVDEIISGLDNGSLRTAEKKGRKWTYNLWVKKAILLSFRLNDFTTVNNAPAYPGTFATWFDKIPSKFQGWDEEKF